MLDIIILVLILIFSIVCHEYAHGWTAYKFGDPTAKMSGRLTLNPLKHVDPIGTVILPGILIALSVFGISTIILGWAKPVPVNFMRLRNPKKSMMWVALAGPVSNIIIAMIMAGIYKLNLLPGFQEVLLNGVFINILLAVFNMVPVPPLDGSRVVMSVLPANLARPYSRIEPYGILIVFGLLYLGLFRQVLLPAIVYIGELMGVRFI